MARVTGTSDIWERVKKVLHARIEPADYLLDLRSTYLAEDTGKAIVVDVQSATGISRLARGHHADIFSALAAVGRPSALVRLRTDLTMGADTPDWYVRELAPPAGTRNMKKRA